MKRFSSYGPIDTDLHYYAPRKELIDKAYTRVVGENRDKGGHYITVWAPRQCGKRAHDGSTKKNRTIARIPRRQR